MKRIKIFGICEFEELFGLGILLTNMVGGIHFGNYLFYLWKVEYVREQNNNH